MKQVLRFSDSIRQENIAYLLVGLSVLFLILVPLGMLLLGTLSPNISALGSGLTLDNYIKAYTNLPYYESLRNTLLIAAMVTVLAISIGGGLAWIIGRGNVPGARVLEVLILVPLFVSPFLGALGWAMAVRPSSGVVGAIVQQISYGARVNLYSPWGIIWVLSLYMAPYPFTFIVSSLRSMDPALEQAASLVGLSATQTARRITLPLVTPAILSATLLVFISVCGQFDVPVLLGLPANFFVITTRLYTLTVSYPSDWSQAATLGTMLLVITIFGVFLQLKALGKGMRQFATITGRGYRPGRVDLGAFRIPLGALAWLYVLVGVVLPVGTLVYASFLPAFSGVYSIDHLTLNNYVQGIIQRPRVIQAVINSVLYSGLAATLSVILTAVISWIIYRSRLPGKRLLEYVCMLPSAVPHIILAVGFLWAFIRTPIYGSMWILILGYVAGFIPIGIRTILPGMSQIDSSLEEAGRISGLNWSQTFGRIVVPLARPSLIAAWLLLFMIFIKELPVSIMLYTEGTQVLSVTIFELWTGGLINETAAVSTIQIALIAFVVILVNRFGTSRELARSM